MLGCVCGGGVMEGCVGAMLQAQNLLWVLQTRRGASDGVVGGGEGARGEGREVWWRCRGARSRPSFPPLALRHAPITHRPPTHPPTHLPMLKSVDEISVAFKSPGSSGVTQG